MNLIATSIPKSFQSTTRWQVSEAPRSNEVKGDLGERT